MPTCILFPSSAIGQVEITVVLSQHLNFTLYMKTNDQDDKKIKRLKQVAKQIDQILSKNPDFKLRGTIDGNVVCSTTIGSGYSTRGYSVNVG